MGNFKFFQNRECEYFPCHKTIGESDLNCLFCYCPLYALGDKCGGGFTYTEEGVKDCSQCLLPHRRDGYEKIMQKIPLLLELAKKP